jgi:uncharacterized iron-regulated membrane protein
MVTCFTGAVLVFEEELQHALHRERYYVEPSGVPRPVSELVTELQKKIPAVTVNSVKRYSSHKRSIELYYSVKAGKTFNRDIQQKGGTPGSRAGGRENSRLIAYFNPYTAELIELYDHRNSWFYTALSLHRWLLSGDTGKLIVGCCTLAFLFILITGIILWWPKTANILRQRLKVKWSGGWKRLNHDLHIVLGFYSAIFLFIFAFTALAWSFQWFNKGIYSVTRSSMEPVKPPLEDPRAGMALISFDEVLKAMETAVSGVRYYTINAPKDSVSPFAVSALSNNAIHETATDNYFISRYRPVITQVQHFSDRNLGQRVRSTFRPVHTASIYGLPSKIIGLIVCLLGVFFPATGYTMWWLRTRKRTRAGSA